VRTYNAKCLVWAPDKFAFLPPDLPEVAFVGRSNSGKSTLINTLVGRKGLARVSGKPGRTRGVVFFEIEERFMLIDLPGYGFASAPKPERKSWEKLIGDYFAAERPLRTVITLFDIRRKPDERDSALIDMMQRYQLPWQAVWTKADKIGKRYLANRCAELANLYQTQRPGIASAHKSRLGRDQLLEWIEAQIIS